MDRGECEPDGRRDCPASPRREPGHPAGATPSTVMKASSRSPRRQISTASGASGSRRRRRLVMAGNRRVPACSQKPSVSGDITRGRIPLGRPRDIRLVPPVKRRSARPGFIRPIGPWGVSNEANRANRPVANRDGSTLGIPRSSARGVCRRTPHRIRGDRRPRHSRLTIYP
ncbi:hypothetical protein MBEHAL_0519 [Halarchaeum acidiphilum MH1-52-1]|uniref:Uncharacterized protein n=1 Tax=Halarchaeum acidiphilum MH1-52-1 TaxID=1261545 RepID=U3A276_9EURY|nr:hypothetical protein MBEHAL_0519 [Halarchaeum acidiphilum MH1-52-1]